MNKKIKSFLSLAGSFSVLIPSKIQLFAANPREKLDQLGNRSGYVTGQDDAVLSIAGTLISYVFSILGIVFVVLVLIAGYNYMTAQGDASKSSAAIASIRRATIGLIIIVGSYAIYAFVWGKITS